MFIKSIRKKDIVDKDTYPFNIPAIQGFEELKLKNPVTFFVGENGSGKSTLLEAIALQLGLNAEGGSNNFNFSTMDTHSNLEEYLLVAKTGRVPKTKYFLRAESFYNVATQVDVLRKETYLTSHGEKSLHEISHGESFIQLIEERFWEEGLYLLDEPEAALSPTKQMQFLIIIDNLVKKGSQFIIATHSPILLAYPEATILNFEDTLSTIDYTDTEIYKTYKVFLDNPERMMSHLLTEEK